MTTAQHLIADGIAAIQAGRVAFGTDLLLQAVEVDGNAPDAWFWLAQSVTTVEERRYCLELAIEIDPEYLPAYTLLAEVGPGPARRPRPLTDQPSAVPLIIPHVGLEAPSPATPARAPLPRLDPLSREVLAIAQALAADPVRLGRWLGYGTRLAEEIRSTTFG